MTRANACLELVRRTKGLTTRAAARRVEHGFNFAAQIDNQGDGIIAYYFGDGSVLLTNTYRRDMQRWVSERV